MTDTMTVGESAQTVARDVWDYKVATIHARHIDVLEREFQALGRDGWHLVFVHLSMANEYQCIFQRPL